MNPLFNEYSIYPLVKESIYPQPFNIDELTDKRLKDVYSYKLSHLVVKTPYPNIVTFIKVLSKASDELYASPYSDANNRFGYNFELSSVSLRNFFLDEDSRYLKSVEITYVIFITQLTRLQLEIDLVEKDINSDAGLQLNVTRCKFLCKIAETIIEDIFK